MKIKEYFYNIKCECCNNLASETWWGDSVDAQTVADEAQFKTFGDKHYCPECYTVNDDDQYETKDGHVYDYDTGEMIK